MCGIAGYFSKTDNHKLDYYLENAVRTLAKRGPDLQQSCILSDKVGFAHARLSIIDTSTLGNQPMKDASGRYTIIFNGEIFNFRELREKFLTDVKFASHSDTEILLYLYIKLRKDCLPLLNGFFAFAIFDNLRKEIFLARDRYGIKPLHIYRDDDMIVFGSELQAIMAFPIKREINYDALALYLQLNYIPGTKSILKNTEKLAPGHFGTLEDSGVLTITKYYSIPFTSGTKTSEDGISYESCKTTLKKLIEHAVKCRLVSDVPLGTFLSGGIDSSIVTACAAKNIQHLNTFSIGYRDDPYLDETYYANLVAKKYNTNHTVFSITADEMFEHIFSILDYTSEPFADSSGIAVYLLSKKTKQKVTVALSGDGGDELFAGYNKHMAELQIQRRNIKNSLIALGYPLLKFLPKSREGRLTNLFRQIQRYSEGMSLTKPERYWQWCTLNSYGNVISLLKNKNLVDNLEIEKEKNFVQLEIREEGDLGDILLADMKMILPNDMLTKVDLMSMANSLEVRVPFLDYNVVNYAFSLPTSFKINLSSGKRILKDAFKEDLPTELFNRPKRGFEVPLLKWMRTGLRSLIENELLEKDFVQHQNIFDYQEIEKIKVKLFSNNPEDSASTIWGLIVFQYWFKKYLASNA
jgi:asparagine synthase (glutamine-hydrolysing)